MREAKLLDNPKHWRNRAEEARVHAERLGDTEARGTMLAIAAGYDRIAERAEERLRSSATVALAQDRTSSR